MLLTFTLTAPNGFHSKIQQLWKNWKHTDMSELLSNLICVFVPWMNVTIAQYSMHAKNMQILRPQILLSNQHHQQTHPNQGKSPNDLILSWSTNRFLREGDNKLSWLSNFYFCHVNNKDCVLYPRPLTSINQSIKIYFPSNNRKNTM